MMSPSDSAPPPHLGSEGLDPTGHRCSKCGREAATAWGDVMTINHGGGEWRCDICALTEQLGFAREMAAAIPGLEHQLQEARARLPHREQTA